jgi:hypothetical protein
LVPLLSLTLKTAASLIGNSIVVKARTSKPDKTTGVVTVEEIQSVRSVDLVSEPATTSGLFESQEQLDARVRVVELETQLADLQSQLVAAQQAMRELEQARSEEQRLLNTINNVLGKAQLPLKTKEALKPLLTILLQEGAQEETLRAVVNKCQASQVISESKEILLDGERRTPANRSQKLAEAFSIEVRPAIDAKQSAMLHEAFLGEPESQEQTTSEAYTALLERFPHLRPRDEQASTVLWYSMSQ